MAKLENYHYTEKDCFLLYAECDLWKRQRGEGCGYEYHPVTAPFVENWRQEFYDAVKMLFGEFLEWNGNFDELKKYGLLQRNLKERIYSFHFFTEETGNAYIELRRGIDREAFPSYYQFLDY